MPTQPTTVVNIARGEAFDIDVGQKGKGRDGFGGNPFIIGKDGTRAEAIAKYERWIQTQPRLLARLPELKGKRLGCFCAGPGGLTAQDKIICHGQVLARLADALPDPPAAAPRPCLSHSRTAGAATPARAMAGSPSHRASGPTRTGSS